MKPFSTIHARLRPVALLAALSLGVAPIVAAPAVATPAAVAAVATAATPAVAATTLVTAPVATLRSSKPTISGKARVGNRLTAKPGRWASGTTFSYTWKVAGTKVATGKTFTPKKKHLGKKVTVAVKGKKSGSTVTRRSAAKTVAKGVFTAPKPTISGTAKVGATLTSKPGTWTPKPTSVRYQWMANGTAIKGATGTRYTLKSAQHGKRITVKVTGTRSAHQSRSRTSAATPAVVRKPRITAQPESALVDAGQTVRLSVSATGGGLRYQWQRQAPGTTTWTSLAGKTSRTLSFTARAKDTLGEYRVVVKNAAGTVSSRSVILFVDSTPSQPYPADTVYVGNYWMQVVSETEVLDLDGGQSEVYALLWACPVGDDVSASPYWDLYSEYRAGGTWYDGEEFDLGTDADGCGNLLIDAIVPTSGARGGIWAVTDHSASGSYAPMTQYVDGLK
ncbi:hypothetical protein MWU57_14675 [Isoptericola sp. S6320L]|uniref:hypothetical protein n=1 Tax=Isoptericola sp. S6320L TaxID=2926411 RepID=UPI001FF689FF|nr:hypothetical protein [Isoptericola sp. S6320L]MCK0118276.1 hypothetical protein [Isoptericola sp. S6320L]